MNISDKNIKKLKSLKEKAYAEIVEEIKDLIEEDGTIYVKLDKIEKDYTYFYKSSDYIIINKNKNTVVVSDNFEENGPLQENENNYNLIQTLKKVKKEVNDAIVRYNRMNNKIKDL